MPFRSLSRVMCLVLLLTGLPAFAQNPRELGTAVLHELSIGDGKLSFRVDSNGCTAAASFKVRADRREDLTPKTAHYQRSIELDLEKDLGLTGKYTDLEASGGDYGLPAAGKRQRLALCLVYRREHFGHIGNYYVYVLSTR